jgi:hypothetical protein
MRASDDVDAGYPLDADAPFTDADLAAEQEQEAARVSAVMRELAAETQPEPWSETEAEARDTEAFAASMLGVPFDLEVQRASPARAWAPSRGQRLTRRQQREYGRYRRHYAMRARRQPPTARRPSCGRPRARQRRDGSRRHRSRGSSSPSGDDGPGEAGAGAQHQHLEIPRGSGALSFAALHLDRLVAR